MILPPYTDAKLQVLAKGLRPNQVAALKAFVQWPDGMPASSAFSSGLLGGLASLGFCERFGDPDPVDHKQRRRLTALGQAILPHLGAARGAANPVRAKTGGARR